MANRRNMPSDVEAPSAFHEPLRCAYELAGTTWQGMTAMRISICNWSTTDEDVARSATAILGAASQARGSLA